MSYSGRIIVTGAEEDLAALASRVRKTGYSPLMVPTIRIEQRPLSPSSLVALRDLAGYDYLFFTSTNAVKIFGRLLKGSRIKRPRPLQVVAVGRATADACARIGFKAHFVPKEFNVREMIDGLVTLTGKKILFPRSAIAPQETIAALRAKGAIVKAIPLYTSVPIRTDPGSFNEMFTEKMRGIIFMSPSSVAGFAKNLRGAILRKLVLATQVLVIGPTTAAAAKEAGFKHIIIAKESTTDGIIETLRNL